MSDAFDGKVALVTGAGGGIDLATVWKMLTRAPIGRFGEPEEIAGAVLWLCGPASTYMIGHALAVDGGYLSR